MNLSQRQKKTIAALTLLCVLAPLLMMPIVFTNLSPLYPFSAFMLLTICLTLFYLYYILNSDANTLVGHIRWLWVLVIIFGSSLGQLVFWYLNIWSNPEASSLKTGGRDSALPPSGGAA